LCEGLKALGLEVFSKRVPVTSVVMVSQDLSWAHVVIGVMLGMRCVFWLEPACWVFVMVLVAQLEGFLAQWPVFPIVCSRPTGLWIHEKRECWILLTIFLRDFKVFVIHYVKDIGKQALIIETIKFGFVIVKEV